MAEKIVCVTGPTACGKTKLAVLLAKRFGGEVVSADSMQIYRGMDIGTAKPSPEETRGVPHHMLDVADPSDDYSVSRYAKEAGAC
ncbi:MAG: tRNA (adenosine(37)-N6)-dimethylallyltransferase MiaA, partial [Oscillibacter sp.]|nr:tRNA (adenosine(37)-N6)-dimethylallyltransferase MiaA [Oscillibacter sp.]